MAKSFLRSGQRSDYLALGENGQTVFDSALQIREALRLRGLDAVANCLAIPQCHHDGDSLDWYAPHQGILTPWSRISTSRRLEALDYLQQRRAELDVVREQCRETDNLTLRLFSLLLRHVLQFPDVQHIWLLNDKPIIAFWGFSPSTQTSTVKMLDALLYEEQAQLATLIQPDAKEDVEVKVNHARTVNEAYEPEHMTTITEADIVPAVIVAPQSQETLVDKTDAAVPKTRVSFAKKVQYLRLSALFIAGSAAIALPVFNSPSPDADSITQQSVAAPGREIKPTPQPEFASALPLHTASMTVVPDVIQPDPEPAKDALVLFPNSIKAGSIKFLNGNWQAQFVDAANDEDKLPALRLQIANGKGEIRLTQNNKVCQATVQAGLLPSGTLSIKSRTRARCRDGSLQTIPDITCKPGPHAVARCQAQWATNESAQLSFKKIDG